jgi:hypothetical protein
MSLPKASRRDFLKVTGEGVAGTALGVTASSYARIIGANDRVGVGIVGFSDRTRSSLIPSFLWVALSMTIAAIQTGQRITFDDAKQQVIVGGHR